MQIATPDLTRREQQVANLVCEGHPNRHIAQLMGISPRTVEVHRSHVLAKLGASNTAQLVAQVRDAQLAQLQEAVAQLRADLAECRTQLARAIGGHA